MALKIKRTFSEEEIKAGITMMCDPGGFARGVMRQRLNLLVWLALLFAVIVWILRD